MIQSRRTLSENSKRILINKMDKIQVLFSEWLQDEELSQSKNWSRLGHQHKVQVSDRLNFQTNLQSLLMITSLSRETFESYHTVNLVVVEVLALCSTCPNLLRVSYWNLPCHQRLS